MEVEQIVRIVWHAGKKVAKLAGFENQHWSLDVCRGRYSSIDDVGHFRRQFQMHLLNETVSIKKFPINFQVSYHRSKWQ